MLIADHFCTIEMWNGIPPDSVVAWNAADVAAGRDPVIAAALAKLGASIR